MYIIKTSPRSGVIFDRCPLKDKSKVWGDF